MHQDGFSGLEFGIVEQHMFDGTKGYRGASSVTQRNTRRHRDHKSCGQVDEVSGEAVDVKAHDPADIFAQIVAALPAGCASPAYHGAIHHDLVARREICDAWTERGNLTRSFSADDQRQLPLCKGHAAESPEVQVVQRNRLDPDLYFAFAGRRWRSDIGKLKLAIGDQS